MIDPERWERAKEIVMRASELAPDEAPPFIADSCANDAELLAEVESLFNYVTMVRPAPRLAPGMTVGGHYRLRQRLGSGGFAVAWLAEDINLHGRRVVIKIPLTPSDDPWQDGKFKGEIEALAALAHPGIVSPLATGTLNDGRPFLVMQHVDGQTLRDVLKGPPPTVERVGSIVRQIGHALRAIADARIYHRDLKPENVMVQRLPDGADHVQLIDFGIATIVSPAAGSLVQTRVVGSLRYMAPEQMLGEATATTDVYAFGVIACELIAAAYGRGDKEYRQTGVTPDIADIALPAGVPRATIRLLEAAVDPVPEKRPSAADAFADELVRTLTQTGSRRATVRGAIAVAAMLVAALVAAVFLIRRPERREPEAAVAVTPAPSRLRVTVVGERSGVLEVTGAELLVDEPFRLRVAPSGTGRVYVFSESPTTGGLNVLFPSSTVNGGTSVVDGGRTQLIPDQSWLVSDGPDADRLWIAWSDAPVERFERARAWATDRYRGRVGDASERRTIVEALTRASLMPTVDTGALELRASRGLTATAIDVRRRR